MVNYDSLCAQLKGLTEDVPQTHKWVIIIARNNQ